MGNTRRFTSFNNVDASVASGEADEGVILTDTIEDWREKTNGIIEKINEINVATDFLLDESDQSLSLDKLAQIGAKKLLGNIGSSTADIAEIEIDVTASGLQDSDVTIPTSKAVRDYVDDRVGSIVQQQYLRIENVNEFNAELIGTTGDRVTTVASTAGAKMINMQGLNFSRDVNADGSSPTNRDMYAGEVSNLRASITPVYANSLIAIEMVLCVEPNDSNSGLWIGELNASDEIQIITRPGYEGYNASIATGRNNFYSSGFYDGDNNSTMKSIPLTYIDKPNTTSEKTYSVIFGSYHNNRLIVTNRVRTQTSNPLYEYGVSSISIKEIRQ